MHSAVTRKIVGASPTSSINQITLRYINMYLRERSTVIVSIVWTDETEV